MLVSGGFNVGHEVTDNCYLSSLPNVSNQSGNAIPQIPGVLTQAARQGFCHVAPPFQAQVKAFVNYPLPWWGIRASATYQSLPGPEITASFVASNSDIAPSLGRNLSSGANGTATIDLIPFGSVYADRINQVDFRVTKSVKVGRVRLEPMLDVYNLFNASPILGVNTRYGAVMADADSNSAGAGCSKWAHNSISNGGWGSRGLRTSSQRPLRRSAICPSASSALGYLPSSR